MRAEKHKSAVLQYQLAKQTIDARGQQLQAEELALNHELCGEGTFDYAADVCVPKPAPPTPSTAPKQ